MFKNWFQVNKKQLVNKLGLHTITRKLEVAYNFCYCFVLTVPLPAVKFLNKLLHYLTSVSSHELWNCTSYSCGHISVLNQGCTLDIFLKYHSPPPTFLKIIFNPKVQNVIFFFAGGGI